jgi:hypothetical protein
VAGLARWSDTPSTCRLFTPQPHPGHRAAAYLTQPLVGTKRRSGWLSTFPCSSLGGSARSGACPSWSAKAKARQR